MKWEFRSSNPVKEKDTKKILNHLIKVRNISNPEVFFNPSPDHLFNPLLLDGMDRAVKIILKNVEEKNKIIVFGDYDVDGVTSTALMVTILKELDGNVEFYIPSRSKEGYGLSKRGIEYAKEKNARLIITVDCGINDSEEIREARKAGIQTIVTDHHIQERETEADVIINPKISDEYPYRKLAGVGVAFKLCQSLQEKTSFSRNILFWNMDLVALGTVADIMPLTGENRILTYLGLKIINERKRPGINALLQQAKLNKKIKAHHISFILGPLLNASGRIKDAGVSVKLLLTRSRKEAGKYASELISYNKIRKNLQEKIFNEACQMFESLDDKTESNSIVLSSSGWHEGVVGIVASKMTEKYHLPSIIISEKDRICKGSARSLPGLNIMKHLEKCSNYLNKYGGHQLAAGIQIRKENIGKFCNELKNSLKVSVDSKDSPPVKIIDFPLQINRISKKLIEELNVLSPHGYGNPQPRFADMKIEVVGYPKIMGSNHLSFHVRKNDKTYKAIAFSQKEKKEIVMNNRFLDICYNPILDSWTGKPILKVLDLKISK